MFSLTRNITKPIVRLRSAAERHCRPVNCGRESIRPVLRRHDEIGSLARDFQRMAEQVEGLVTAQRDLLGDVSHELRSPLARLIVALGLLRPGLA